MIRHKKENMMTMNQIIGNLSKNIETRIQTEIIRKKKKKKKSPRDWRDKINHFDIWAMVAS